MMKLGLILALSLGAQLSAQTPAPPAPLAPPPCAGPEFRTLDFWVGEWIAEDDKGKRIGTNRITRDEYGACVVTEHFLMDDGTMKGHSVSIYRPGLKQWRQNWVDDQGGYFDFVGGPVSGADHIFVFENKRVAETQQHQRMIFQDVKPRSFVWRWQGKKQAGDVWADSWVIHYRRK
jgi:hypothetical protein